MRARYVSTSARQVSLPLFIAAWIVAMFVSTTGNADFGAVVAVVRAHAAESRHANAIVFRFMIEYALRLQRLSFRSSRSIRSKPIGQTNKRRIGCYPFDRSDRLFKRISPPEGALAHAACSVLSEKPHDDLNALPVFRVVERDRTR